MLEKFPRYALTLDRVKFKKEERRKRFFRLKGERTKHKGGRGARDKRTIWIKWNEATREGG